MSRFLGHCADYLVYSDREDLRELVGKASLVAARIVHAQCVQFWFFNGKELILLKDLDEHAERAPNADDLLDESVLKGPTKYAKEHSRIKPGDGFIGQCLVTGKPVLGLGSAEDSGPDTRLNVPVQQRVVAAIPARFESKTVGVLGVIDSRPPHFTRTEIGCLETHAQKAMLALHHSLFFPEVAPSWIGIFTQECEKLTGGQEGTADYWSGLGFPPIPKGINLQTLRLISNYLLDQRTGRSRKEISECIGVSHVTLGRYLSYLTHVGLVTKGLNRLPVGRPANMYRVTDIQAKRLDQFIRGSLPIAESLEDAQRFTHS